MSFLQFETQNVVFVGILIIVIKNDNSFSMAGASLKAENRSFADAKHAVWSSTPQKEEIKRRGDQEEIKQRSREDAVV